MAIDYTQAQGDPLLGSSSRTSDYTPYIQAAQQASGILSNAANSAGNTAANNYGLAQSQIRAGNVNSAAYNNPYVNLGLSATQRLQGLISNPSSIVNDPGYQFNLDQQMQQLQNQNVAGGKLLSGQNIQDVAKLTSGYASNTYNQALQAAQQQAQIGQTSAMNQGNQDFQAGQAIGGYQGQIGDTLGSSQVAAANAQARGLYDASRGLVAQTTARSTPFNATNAGGNGAVINGGVQDSTIPMNQKSFEDYQKQLAGLTSNKAANATPMQNQTQDKGPTSAQQQTTSGNQGGSQNLGGAAPTAGGTPNNLGSSGPTNTGSDYGSYLNRNSNTGGYDMGGSAEGLNFAGSSSYNPNLSGGYLTGLGNAGGTGLAPGTERGIGDAVGQGASQAGGIAGLAGAIGQGAQGALNMSRTQLPGEAWKDYQVRQQRIFEAQNPDVVAQAVARGNRQAGSVFGG